MSDFCIRLTGLNQIWVLSQAENIITVVWTFRKTWQIHKMTTISTENDSQDHVEYWFRIGSILWICLVLQKGHTSVVTLSQPNSKIKYESSESVNSIKNNQASVHCENVKCCENSITLQCACCHGIFRFINIIKSLLFTILSKYMKRNSTCHYCCVE